ncbi:MAG: Riboflavin transporter [Alphaproteobacteria bacterium MarineAlpha11_Bin1]|nr:MAG: Riboflavin transporter [Alphaproteobacteria bacterium MarineAlpha11_Bin1]
MIPSAARHWFDSLPGPIRGAIWLIASAFCLTAMAATIRHISTDVHTFIIAFFRTGLGFIFMAPWLMRTRGQGLKTDKIPYFVGRTFFVAIGTLGYFYALSKIPLADAVAIMFSRPLYGTIFAIVFLGELVGLRRWTALLIGFLGVLIMVRPGFEVLNVGLASVFIASIAGAGSAVFIRFLSRTESPDTITIYYVIFTTPIMLLLALFVWQTPTWEQLGWLLFMGLVGTLGQRAMSRGFAAADASIMLPMDYTRLIVAALFGFILFSEIPSIYTALGGLLIFFSTVYIARREARNSKDNASL